MGGVLLLACTPESWGRAPTGASTSSVQGAGMKREISSLTFGPLFPRLTQALVAILLGLGDSWQSPSFLTLSPASASRDGLGWLERGAWLS